MTRKPRARTTKAPETAAPWSAVLLSAAAADHIDGGARLHVLLARAGFGTKPSMSIVVKRPARIDRGKPVDPLVDDVLDALRSLCA